MVAHLNYTDTRPGAGQDAVCRWLKTRPGRGGAFDPWPITQYRCRRHDGTKYAEFTILGYRYSLNKFIAKRQKRKKWILNN